MRPVSVGKNLTANTLTTMYTVPKQYTARFYTLYAHNSGGSTKHFSAWWYDKSTNTEIVIVLEYNLSSKTYLQLDGSSYVFLEDGDEIRVKSETGSAVSCIVTMEQEYQASTQHGF
jgi:hypothetical protein